MARTYESPGGYVPPTTRGGYWGGLGTSTPQIPLPESGMTYPNARRRPTTPTPTKTPAYDRPEVREAVSKLLPTAQDTRAAIDQATAEYQQEMERMRRQMADLQRQRQAEIDQQFMLQRQQRKSAYDAVVADWSRQGLNGKEIRKALQGLAETDYLDTHALVEAVRGTQSWANRYGAVVNARQKKGLPFLSEGEIQNLETQYRQVMSAANMPKGFYDSHKDFQNWIANDVSVKEISDRVALAEKAIANTDPDYIKAMKQMYGVKRSDLAAYMLDRKRGVEVLTQKLQAVDIGAEALESGVKMDTKFAEELVDKNIGREQARSAFNTVKQEQSDWNRLAGLDRTKISERSLIEDELALDPKTGIKKKRLSSHERARFGGAARQATAFGDTGSGSY